MSFWAPARRLCFSPKGVWRVKVVASPVSKILAHRTISPLSVIHPLSQLGLARSYVLQGDTARARTAYQDFLALWKDADPDTPILKQAKAEYAKLQ